MKSYGLEKFIVKNLIRFNKKPNNGEIINLHQCKTDNSGDLMCAPYLYFDELKTKSKTLDILGYSSKKDVSNAISWANTIKSRNIILGGGGLLDRKTFKTTIQILQLLQQKGNKIVLWGVGHNNPNLITSALYQKQLKGFHTVGVRDYDIKDTDWVPCVSCMNDIFSQDYLITREYGVIEHKDIPIKGIENNQIPRIKNNIDFNKIVDFIGQSEKIITNSYHVMYWSLLLNRKVIVIPNSSKMFSFKYPVPFCKEASNFKELFKKANIYTDLLEECRERNIQFSKKAFNYLEIDKI